MRKVTAATLAVMAGIGMMGTVSAMAENTYNIGYSNLAMKEDFFITVENGIYTAAEKMGYTYNTTVSDQDSAKMAQNIEALITKGADIIISFDVLPEQGSAIGEDLAKEGIPMMSIDCDYGEDVYFFGVNNYSAGENLGESLVSFVEDRFDGQIDYVVGVWNAIAGDTVKQRCDGAVDVLKETFGIDDDQVAWLDSQGDDTKTLTMVKDWLDAHPDAEHVVFVAQNDDRGFATNQAVMDCDRVENCIIGSHNADPSSLENLAKYEDGDRENAWVCTVSYNSFLYGEQIIAYATDILDGNAEEEMARYAETTIITSENVEEYQKKVEEVTSGYLAH